MSKVDRWLLPDGIEELLPPQGLALERTRRQILDKFQSWGYELVVTPMVEFLESLLTGTGSDLDLKTFKVTDQVSGRTLGIRADITPQVARMDAHSLRGEQQNRLCYVGTVLHAKADNMLASRAPISIGAELFGGSTVEDDCEAVSLMLDTLSDVSSAPIHLELGDVGIYRALVAGAGLSESQEQLLFDKIQGKALPDLQSLLDECEVEVSLAQRLLVLPTLCGGEKVIETALKEFSDFPDIVKRIRHLHAIAQKVAQRFSNIRLNYDLSELRGYNYHTGIVFAAFLGDSGVRVAKGGRYDDVGQVFGRARGAVGFDIDLKTLVRHTPVSEESANIVCVPAVPDNVNANASQEMWQAISELRDKGYIVVEGVTENATQHLVLQEGRWMLVSANAENQTN